ncbi:MAG: amidohydrolase family protein [Acidobacteria bacterium]|nr:amidohydrolase family protein [Acidobacteriota bacterium]
MKTWRIRAAIGAIILAGLGQFLKAQESLPPEIMNYPDTILHNGKILTADDAFSIAQAVAIRDGRFIAVGDSARILRMEGPQTQLIDLQGRTVTPGLIDTHFHLHNYAFNRYVNGEIDVYPAVLIHDLEGSETKESFLRALRKKALETPPRDGWIVLTDARGEDHGVIEGDMSTDAYLDEIERGLKERVIEAYGQRFASDHSIMLTRETPKGNQFERMKKLGIIPSLKIPTLFRELDAGDDPNNIPTTSPIERMAFAWGKDRVARMLPAQSLIQAGFLPTSESDTWYYPASSPLYSLEKLVDRKDDRFGEVWGPEERVTRQQALWMRTKWAARYTADEKDLGSIEPGKLADLVVLDKDYLTVPEETIGEIPVRMTIIAGKVVYDSARDHVSLPVLPPPSR